MDCGKQCIRILMFIFNFIFFILGLVLLGVGAYSRVKAGDYESVWGSDNTIMSAANLLIAAGVLVAIIGFVGCCGAWKSNKILLGIFAALVILIFIVEVAGGALAYTKRAIVQDALQKGLKAIVTTNYKYSGGSEAQKGAKTSMDFFQQTVKCCGTAGPNDWKVSSWYTDAKKKATTVNGTTTQEVVPGSCCTTKDATNCNRGEDTKAASTLTTIFTKGCYIAGFDFIKSNMWVIGGAAIGIAVIQLLGVIFAICLICAIKKEEDTA